MSQSSPSEDEAYIRNWIETFPLHETLREMGRRLAEYPPLRVILVTFATGHNPDTDGMWEMMRMIRNDPVRAEDHPEEIPNVRNLYDKIPLYTNRLDVIFDSDNRQGDRGRYTQGQAEFCRIYMREMQPMEFANIFMKIWYRIFDAIEDYSYRDLPFCHLLSCRHGHHRSQAVVSLLQRLIWRYWEYVDVQVLHMDDRRHRKTMELLADPAFRAKFVSGLRKILSPPIYYVPLHRPATPDDMEQ